MKKNKKNINVFVYDFYIKVNTYNCSYTFDMLREDSLFFHSLLNHFKKNDYDITISLKDLAILKKGKWL